MKTDDEKYERPMEALVVQSLERRERESIRVAMAMGLDERNPNWEME